MRCWSPAFWPRGWDGERRLPHPHRSRLLPRPSRAPLRPRRGARGTVSWTPGLRRPAPSPPDRPACSTSMPGTPTAALSSGPPRRTSRGHSTPAARSRRLPRCSRMGPSSSLPSRASSTGSARGETFATRLTLATACTRRPSYRTTRCSWARTRTGSSACRRMVRSAFASMPTTTSTPGRRRPHGAASCSPPARWSTRPSRTARSSGGCRPAENVTRRPLSTPKAPST